MGQEKLEMTVYAIRGLIDLAGHGGKQERQVTFTVGAEQSTGSVEPVRASVVV